MYGVFAVVPHKEWDQSRWSRKQRVMVTCVSGLLEYPTGSAAERVTVAGFKFAARFEEDRARSVAAQRT